MKLGKLGVQARMVAALVGLLSFAAAALPATQARAARPSPSSATLTVNPDPAPANSSFQISGCGYTAGYVVALAMAQPTASAFTTATVDSNGCISRAWNTNAPGSYTLQASEYLNGLNRKPTVMASVTFSVY